MRLYTMRLASSGDGLVRTLRPLTETNATIARVRWLLLGLTLGGALAAGLLGRLAANAVLAPRARARGSRARGERDTRSHPADPGGGRDELAAWPPTSTRCWPTSSESQRAQQQLIADASHELRTPLTAHRANIELLARPDLPGTATAARARRSRPRHRGALDPGRRPDSGRPRREVRRRSRAARARRARGNGGRASAAQGAGAAPGARAGALPRSPPPRARDWSAPSTTCSTTRSSGAPRGGTVDIRLAGGTLTVRDHGPGIADGGPAARLRPLLPRSRRPRAARLRARARDRQADRRRPRRQRHRRQCGRWRSARDAPLRRRRAVAALSATSQRPLMQSGRALRFRW